MKFTFNPLQPATIALLLVLAVLASKGKLSSQARAFYMTHTRLCQGILFGVVIAGVVMTYIWG